MRLTNPDRPLTRSDWANLEAAIGFEVPMAVRSFYDESNGGEPDRCVFSSERLETLVADFLPVISTRPGWSGILDTYRDLTAREELPAESLLPFAVDPGGDYFLVDCASPDGDVYFYAHDHAPTRSGLLRLELTFVDFLARLRTEAPF